jgi:hypothetical protein
MTMLSIVWCMQWYAHIPIYVMLLDWLADINQTLVKNIGWQLKEFSDFWKELQITNYVVSKERKTYDWLVTLMLIGEEMSTNPNQLWDMLVCLMIVQSIEEQKTILHSLIYYRGQECNLFRSNTRCYLVKTFLILFENCQINIKLSDNLLW